MSFFDLEPLIPQGGACELNPDQFSNPHSFHATVRSSPSRVLTARARAVAPASAAGDLAQVPRGDWTRPRSITPCFKPRNLITLSRGLLPGVAADAIWSRQYRDCKDERAAVPENRT